MGGRTTARLPATGHGWGRRRARTSRGSSGATPCADSAVGRLLATTKVVVNGPKTWSLAAAQHPDIAEAYGTAQARAAEQISGRLGQRATIGVGSRGGQVQVPVEVAEAVTVTRYTSRAGDPR